MQRKVTAMLLTAAMMLTALTACGTPAASGSDGTGSTSDDGKQPETVYEISIGTVYANDHIFAQGLDRMADELLEASNGQLKITTYHNSTMGSEREQVDAVSAGTLTMSLPGAGQLGQLYAPILVFDSVYCLRDNDHLQAVVVSDLGQEMWEDMAAETSIRSLGAMDGGARYITTSRTPVYTPDDLKGLKIRVPDQEMSIANFAAFGANPTPMALSEVYLALSQNVVDGQENPLAQIMTQKFYEVQSYVSTSCHVVQSVFLVINEQFYQGLPEDLRTLLADTCAKYCRDLSLEIVDYDQNALEELEALGMTICEADLDAFKACAKGVIEENEYRWGEGLYDEIQAIQ